MCTSELRLAKKIQAYLERMPTDKTVYFFLEIDKYKMKVIAGFSFRLNKLIMACYLDRPNSNFSLNFHINQNLVFPT